MIGIILGVFTALVISQVYVQFIVSTKALSRKALIGFSPLPQDEPEPERTHKFSFVGHRRIYYIVTAAILVIGIGFGVVRGFNMGIDFTGGTRIQLAFEKKVNVGELKQALKKYGINDPEITSAGKASENTIMIKTKKALDKNDRQKIETDFAKSKTLKMQEDGVRSFEQFGPSIGKLITQNAIKAVLFAALGMLIYIMFRFRWRFALASIAGVFHDVLLMIAFYGIFNITVNNPFIAAILTVVGYSINDTIVVFDRIRENHGIMSRKVPLDGLIDRSIYQTLVRSLVTGFTTVLAILPLVIFGGDAIREFVLPLMVGIIAGAASSILIASSLYYEFAKGAYKKDKYFGAAPKGGGGGGGGVGGSHDRQPKKRVEKRDDLPNAGAVV
jgi:SecD/SecF fusion protein